MPPAQKQSSHNQSWARPASSAASATERSRSGGNWGRKTAPTVVTATSNQAPPTKTRPGRPGASRAAAARTTARPSAQLAASQAVAAVRATASRSAGRSEPGSSARSRSVASTRASSQSSRPIPSSLTLMFAGPGSPCTTARGVPASAAQARRQAATASVGRSERSTSPPRSAVSSSRVDADPGRCGQPRVSSCSRRSVAATAGQSRAAGGRPSSQVISTTPATCRRPSGVGTTAGTRRPDRPRCSSSRISQARLVAGRQGPARHQPPAGPLDLDDLVAVPAAERPDPAYRSPGLEHPLHPAILPGRGPGRLRNGRPGS